MAIPNDFVQASLIIVQSYARLRSAVAADAQPALDTIVGSVVPPERVSEFFEFGYAHRESLSPELREAVADVGHFAWTNGFWGLGVDGRGAAMETLLRGGNLAAGATAPEPSSKYVLPEAKATLIPGGDA